MEVVMEEEALTTTEAATLLDVTTPRVMNLVNQGKLRSVKTPEGRVLISKADVLARKRALKNPNKPPRRAVFEQAVAE
jgi:excisionase family DNA binding protein